MLIIAMEKREDKEREKTTKNLIQDIFANGKEKLKKIISHVLQ